MFLDHWQELADRHVKIAVRGHLGQSEAIICRRNETLTVADNVAGAGLDGLVSPEATQAQITENTTGSKLSETSPNCRAEIMSPLL